MGTGGDKHYERWLGFESLWIVVVLLAIFITLSAIDADAVKDDGHGHATGTEHVAAGGSHGAH